MRYILWPAQGLKRSARLGKSACDHNTGGVQADWHPGLTLFVREV